MLLLLVDGRQLAFCAFAPPDKSVRALLGQQLWLQQTHAKALTSFCAPLYHDPDFGGLSHPYVKLPPRPGSSTIKFVIVERLARFPLLVMVRPLSLFWLWVKLETMDLATSNAEVFN
jgi:hypothetical protein